MFNNRVWICFGDISVWKYKREKEKNITTQNKKEEYYCNASITLNSFNAFAGCNYNFDELSYLNQEKIQKDRMD